MDKLSARILTLC